MLWEIVTHDHPRRGQLRQLKTPDECPQCIADLIDRCHSRHPRDRPSAAEVRLLPACMSAWQGGPCSALLSRRAPLLQLAALHG